MKQFFQYDPHASGEEGERAKKGWLKESFYICCAYFFKCLDLTVHNFEMLTQHNPNFSKEKLFLGHFISKFMSFSEWQKTVNNSPESAKIFLDANYIADSICLWKLSSDMPSV